MILFVLLCNDLVGQDSTKVGFSTNELQLNYALLTELEWRRSESALHKLKIKQQDQQIQNYKNLSEIQRQVEMNLNKQLELSKPPFYDNFIFGAATGVALTTILVILLK